MNSEEAEIAFFKLQRSTGVDAKLDSFLATHPELFDSDEWQAVVLNIAACTGDIRLLDLMHKHGANINLQYRGLPVLNGAASTNQLEAIKWFVGRHSKVNHMSTNGSLYCGALESAILNDNFEMVQVLLDAGALVNGVGPRGMTPLDWAISVNSNTLIGYIKNYGGVSSRQLS